MSYYLNENEQILLTKVFEKNVINIINYYLIFNTNEI